MASHASPVWFVTGCSTGFGRASAEALIAAVTAPEPLLHLLLGAPALEMAHAKLHPLRATFDAWMAANLGADHPEHGKAG